MCDVFWTPQKPENEYLTVTVVMSPNGNFIVTDRGMVNGLQTVDVYDIDWKMSWKVTVPGDKDVLHRALEFVRSNRSPFILLI